MYWPFLLDYSQCVPGAAPVSPTSPTAPTSPSPTTIITPSGTCLPNNPAANSGSTRFKGINIAGFDFGCDTTGTCTESAAWPPLTEFYGADGVGQMTHFVQNDGMNVFRLPVGWQFLTGNEPSGTLKAENFAKYDKLVQACLSTGASCIIDVHNYARFNGKVKFIYSIRLLMVLITLWRLSVKVAPLTTYLPHYGVLSHLSTPTTQI